jgi:predicted transcriptional regulator
MNFNNKAAPGAGCAVAASEIIVALDNGPRTFSSLIHSIRASSDATMTAALAELTEGGFLQRDGGEFSLSPRGAALVGACRRQRRPRGGPRRH